MALQPSVVEFFNNRKRPAEELKKTKPNKALVLDSSSLLSEEESHIPDIDCKLNKSDKKLVYISRPTDKGSCLLKYPKFKPPTSAKSRSTQSRPRPSVVKKKSGQSSKYDCNQMDIRKTLLKLPTNKSEEQHGETYKKQTATVSSINKLDENQKKNVESLVSFQIKGPLSPSKSTKLPDPTPHEGEIKTGLSRSSHESTEAATISSSSSRKELNLSNIKAMMSRSSRLEEMKAALKRFNENKAKLNEEQAKNSEAESFTLDAYKSCESQDPSSPMKTPTKRGHIGSPQGKLTPCSLFATPPRVAPSSPLKSPLKSPAFQRYQALVTEGRPVLELPFKYRAIAELFRCIDTVASMIHNRKETITLSNLKPGVQEISRKNLSEYLLGQIKTVFPGAFDFKLEKMRSLGSSEKYELVITPLFGKEGETESNHVMMTPSILLARRRTLFNILLELTKDHHEEFLKSLEPPMCIPRSRLTRWHPEFSVDDVPDIISSALPHPPNVEKAATAKDVLERARNLFVVNPRMERALQRVSENCSSPALSSSASTTIPNPINNKPPLHGVPASLLEKVRAKQAARALEAMTRSPAQAKEAVRLTRLPEIARILRNLFVAEKKGVLTREQVLCKLSDSYRESLSHGELDDHLKLLGEKTPGWVTFCNIRKTDYVKLSRSADMNRVMARLEALAEEKCV